MESQRNSAFPLRTANMALEDRDGEAELSICPFWRTDFNFPIHVAILRSQPAPSMDGFI